MYPTSTDAVPANTLTVLASALKIEHRFDAAAGRAADKITQLDTLPIYWFDGVEMTVQSFERNNPVQYVTDGESCTCKAGKHPWCKHRVLYRTVLAAEVLRNPAFLRSLIAMQLAPAEPLPFEPRGVELLAGEDLEDWMLS